MVTLDLLTTIKSIYKKCNNNAPIEGNRIQNFTYKVL